MGAYSLPQWVHLCFTTDGAVFLDTRRDKYFGLDYQKAQLLLRVLERDAAAMTAEHVELAQELHTSGLLTPSHDATCPPFSAAAIAPPDALLCEPDDLPERITLLQVARFVAACCATWVAFHLGSLDHAVVRLKRRKARLLKRGSSNDLDRTRELICAFFRLRTFVYTADDHCLFDSLVAADYLQRFGVSSTCVFGVRTLPFAAHCWVQTNGHLVTDSSLEQLRAFSPIFTI